LSPFYSNILLYLRDQYSQHSVVSGPKTLNFWIVDLLIQ
jgi:hypothetical protein